MFVRKPPNTWVMFVRNDIAIGHVTNGVQTVTWMATAGASRRVPQIQSSRTIWTPAALFNLLGSEIVPLFYERNADGLPERWLVRVKTSMRRLIPRFSAERMLRGYIRTLYEKK